MANNLLPSEFYHSLINQSCGLICVVDESGICKYVNEPVFNITGYKQEEFLGKLLIEYLHNDDIASLRNAFLQLKTYKIVETPFFRIKTKSGTWRWIDAVITNTVDNEHVDGYVIEARDVTLKKATLDSLEKSQSFFHSFFNIHPEAVFTLNTDGIFEQVNNRICRMISYRREDVIGEHFSKFITASFTFEAMKAIINAKNGNASSLEGKVVSKHGQILTLRFTIIPIYTQGKVTSILGTAKDITAEKQALKEIEKLALIASKTVSCVMITDAAGITEWVNSEFTRVTGYTMQEAIGKKPGTLLQGPRTNQETVLEMRKMLAAKIPFSTEILNYRKNGEEFWFNMDITPLFDDEGRISKFFALQTDVTERNEAENKTRLLAEDLTRRNRELQQFNYIVSHNLRAPVANILGLLSVLENKDADERTVEKAFEKMKQTALNLDHVIKDLDEILSLRKNGNGNHHDVVNLSTTFTEVCASMQDKIDTIHATVKNKIPDDVSILASRSYVYSIFHNLLSNSLKYISKTTPVCIEIDYAADQDMHTVIFKDNGKGIDLERFGDQMFKLYGKFDKQEDGRGIGLYMVKTQVEALGGTLDVKSEPGKGTSFYLHFNKIA